MKIDVRSDMGNTAIKLEKVGKQLRFVVSRALNLTTGDVRREIERQIPRKIQSPTAYTKQALWTKTSNKANLEAQVFLKDAKRSGARFSHQDTLGHLFVPAPTRNASGLERMMYRSGYLKRGEYLLPSTGAKLDSYGNMSRGQIKQIITQLKMSVSEYDNASKSKRSMRNRRRSGTIFWSDGTKGLSRGLFIRVGRELQCLAAIIRQPRYAVRINMEKVSQGIVKSKFEQHLDKAIGDAMRTAKP